MHDISFAIKHNMTLESADALLREVSDPLSKSYGRYYSLEEVNNKFSNPSYVKKVKDWLRQHNITIIQESSVGYVTGRMTAQEAVNIISNGSWDSWRYAP